MPRTGNLLQAVGATLGVVVLNPLKAARLAQYCYAVLDVRSSRYVDELKVKDASELGFQVQLYMFIQEWQVFAQVCSVSLAALSP